MNGNATRIAVIRTPPYGDYLITFYDVSFSSLELYANLDNYTISMPMNTNNASAYIYAQYYLPDLTKPRLNYDGTIMFILQTNHIISSINLTDLSPL